jgi:hypothetical protein
MEASDVVLVIEMFNEWLNFGIGTYSKAQVEGVKLVTRLTPFLAVMVPFWGIYSQMSTAFQNQVRIVNSGYVGVCLKSQKERNMFV